MITRLIYIGMVVAGLLVLSASSITAQGGDGAIMVPLPTAGDLEEEYMPAVQQTVWRQNPADEGVIPGEPGFSFRYVGQFGEKYSGYFEDSSHFYGVSGLATDGDNIWITDTWSNRALKFDSEGHFLQQIGKASYREAVGTSLDLLRDVAVDALGNVYLADASAAYVVKFAASGTPLGTYGQRYQRGSDNDHFNAPLSIAVDSTGNLYITDSDPWSEAGNHRVQVFTNAGNYITTIGVSTQPGSDNTHLRSPRHVALYDNTLYIADAGNHRIQLFNVSDPSSPTYLATIGVSGQAGNDNAHFNFPEGVGIDANFIYVADSNNNRVQVFNRTTRTYVATLGTGFYGTGNDAFNHPVDIVIMDGRLYVADDWNNRVQQFDLSH